MEDNIETETVKYHSSLRERSGLWAVSVVLALCSLSLPLLFVFSFDDGSLAKMPLETEITLLVVCVACLLDSILYCARSYVRVGAESRLSKESFITLVNKVYRADVGELERAGPAVIEELAEEIGKARRNHPKEIIIYALPVCISYLLIIAYVGGWLVFVPLLLVGLILINLIQAYSKLEVLIEDHVERRISVRNWILSMGLIESTSKNSFMKKNVQAGIKNSFDELKDIHAQVDALRSRIASTMSILTAFCCMMILLSGSVPTVIDSLSLGELIACSFLTLFLFRPFNAVLEGIVNDLYLSQLSKRLRALSELDESISTVDSQDAPVLFQPGTPLPLSIKLSEKQKIDIRAGEIVRLKSTNHMACSQVMSQIGGVKRQTVGEVRVSGVLLGEFTPEERYSLITYIADDKSDFFIEYFETYSNEELDEFSKIACQMGLSPLVYRQYRANNKKYNSFDSIELEKYSQCFAVIHAQVRMPQILLIENVGAGLDIEQQENLAVLIRKLSGHTTVIFTTNCPVFSRVGDRTVMLVAERSTHGAAQFG